jgi:GTP-binding protein Era
MSKRPKGRFVCGFVAILGRPNSGKSTLLNALTGMKLAIVGPKPQTTRTSIQGVMNLPNAQVVFLDTPGIHKAVSLLGRRMMSCIKAALDERDLLLYVVDAAARYDQQDADALRLVIGAHAPVLLLLNKLDRLRNKERLLELIERYRGLYDFAGYIPVSGLTGEGLDSVQRAIVERLPAGPPLFPPDYITDQPERFLAAELIREKALLYTREEVPHSLAVTVEQWHEEGLLTRISATLNVEREGHKGIIIGARGAMLKRIGTAARLEMERLLSRKIFLELFVRVRPGWREDPGFLDAVDWRSMVRSEVE